MNMCCIIFIRYSPKRTAQQQENNLPPYSLLDPHQDSQLRRLKAIFRRILIYEVKVRDQNGSISDSQDHPNT
ncbi:unnamed protein product [Alternaria alternata]